MAISRPSRTLRLVSAASLSAAAVVTPLAMAPAAFAAPESGKTSAAEVADANIVELPASATVISDVAANDRLKKGQSIGKNTILASKNGKYGFFINKKGEAFHFEYTSADRGKAIWRSSTSNLDAVTMNNAGRLRFMTDENTLWARSNNATAKKDTNARFIIKNNGTAIIKHDKSTVWTLGTDKLVTPGTNTKPNVLKAGTKFVKGDRLVSKNERYLLKLNAKGNLVVRDTKKKKAIWKSDTKNKDVKTLVVRKNGNMVLLDSDKKRVWHTNTKVRGAKNPRLVLRNSGELQLMHGRDVKWSSTGNVDVPGTPGDGDSPKATVFKPGTMHAGKTLKSPNGEYSLYFTAWGTLQLMEKDSDWPLWFPIYDSIAYGSAMTLTKDGNLTVSDVDGTVVWESGTAKSGVKNPRLLLTNDGQLIIKHGKKNVWQVGK